MRERVRREFDLLSSRFPAAEISGDGKWIRIPDYPLPGGWSASATDVAFEVRAEFPGAPPYGFFVRAGLLFKGGKPNNYAEPGPSVPAFPGAWGFFSWTPEKSDWQVTDDPAVGASLMKWAVSFTLRLKEGM